MDKINILIVDDRPEGLMSLEAVLNRASYNIVTASSGEEALARVLDHDFCVIIMDVQMPGMDGFETVRVIKQREKSKDIPVIFMTANNKDTHFVHRGYQGGAVDYIFKPFDPLVLSSKVAIFVELYLKSLKIREQSKRLQQAEVRERGRQLAALQMESLNRYRHLADAVPHTVWKLNREGSLEYCNRWWQNYSGLTLEQISGTGWQSSVHHSDLPNLLAKLEGACRSRTALETECRLMAKDGAYRWHMFRAVPEVNSADQVNSWIVTNTDIEDRKKIESDLIRAKEESSAASQAKSAFLANMSHEIRTPLGIVLGYAELLANPEIDLATRQDYFMSVKRNGELLSQLIGDILDLSKIEAGHLEVEKIQFSLPEFLNGAIQSFRHQARQKNIELRTELTGPIPVSVLSDPTRLRQILFNVVSNAIKFTERGLVNIQVGMGAPSDHGHGILKIRVEDQGIGITADQAKKLFQPFIQAHSSTTRKYGGTGLGLALSRRLARQLGGDIALAEHQGDVGTAFVVRIDVGSLEGVDMTSTLESRVETVSAPLPKHQLAGVNVLIVEDAPENQFLLKYILTKAGASVATADNGQDGMERALAEQYDIVLMDIQMPILDGYQAARLLREKGYTKPILALTAYALKEERERCLAAGCNDHLTKPINRMDLLQHMTKYCGTREFHS